MYSSFLSSVNIKFSHLEVEDGTFQDFNFRNVILWPSYTCKKCGEPNFLTPHAFWNITDFGGKCEKCETINT
jgi:hypothetical protein